LTNRRDRPTVRTTGLDLLPGLDPSADRRNHNFASATARCLCEQVGEAAARTLAHLNHATQPYRI
jgi:hypothetical protein